MSATHKDEGSRTMNIFRRLPLSRLLLLGALVVVIGVSATALASAVGSAPVPQQKSLPQAIHDALSGPSVEGLSANVTLTNHLLEGANLAGGTGQGGGGTLSNPLIKGGSGRIWVSKSGDVRLELQAEKGDTNLVWDGHTVTVYDAESNTVYRYTPKDEGSSTSGDTGTGTTSGSDHEVPSVAKIEEAISHLQHVNLSDAKPTDVGGQPAYTVRITPKETGSLIAGAELSFDAVHGTPLRAAVYSTQTSAPVIELAASEVSYGPVDSSVFTLNPPSNAKVEEIQTPHGGSGTGTKSGEKPSVTVHGSGITSVAVAQTKAGSGTSSSLENLPKVSINGVSASELKTELGTILTFERGGARYIVGGAVDPSAVEAIARGL